jgi:UDP-glucose:(heptosyl)LPS alpha-1,3-glucosyltransferase
MRLAFVKKRFSLHGGAELYLRTMLGELKKEGHDLHVFANDWTEEPGVRFHKVKIIQATSFLSALTFSKNAASALKHEKFDCIMSFERAEYQDIYRAGDGCHRAWLGIRSEFEPSHRRISFKVNPFHLYTLALEKKIFANTPVIVVNSLMVKKQIMKYYSTPSEKIIVAYNGVDLETYSPDGRDKWRSNIRASLGINEKDKVLLFVGTGFKRKGVEVLIRALPMVMTNENERVIALIVGRGEAAYYERLSNGLGVSGNVVFTGPQSGIEKYYAAADVFVLPTIYDPFSNACLEAMASGLPVITTRNNGAAEVLEQGKEGFVINSVVDHTELADKLILALEDAGRMGSLARTKAERFGIAGAAAYFIRLMKETAATKQQP